MTAAAAPTMHGPDGMRLFLVAAPAAVIAALLAAASTDGNTSLAAEALAPGELGYTPGTPAGQPHVCPAQARGYGQASARRCRAAAPTRREPPWCRQLDARGRRSVTPRMAGCQHGMRPAGMVLVSSFPFVTRRIPWVSRAAYREHGHGSLFPRAETDCTVSAGLAGAAS